MKLIFHVDNIRREGCVRIIENHLKSHPSIESIEVNIDAGTVTIEANREDIRNDIAQRLKKMGYPEKGSTDGIKSVKAKASSLVSCAMGKINKSRHED